MCRPGKLSCLERQTYLTYSENSCKNESIFIQTERRRADKRSVFLKEYFFIYVVSQTNLQNFMHAQLGHSYELISVPEHSMIIVTRTFGPFMFRTSNLLIIFWENFRQKGRRIINRLFAENIFWFTLTNINPKFHVRPIKELVLFKINSQILNDYSNFCVSKENLHVLNARPTQHILRILPIWEHIYSSGRTDRWKICNF